MTHLNSDLGVPICSNLGISLLFWIWRCFLPEQGSWVQVESRTVILENCWHCMKSIWAYWQTQGSDLWHLEMVSHRGRRNIFNKGQRKMHPSKAVWLPVCCIFNMKLPNLKFQSTSSESSNDVPMCVWAYVHVCMCVGGWVCAVGGEGGHFLWRN